MHLITYYSYIVCIFAILRFSGVTSLHTFDGDEKRKMFRYNSPDLSGPGNKIKLQLCL